jgi:hypothetical protein
MLRKLRQLKRSQLMRLLPKKKELLRKKEKLRRKELLLKKVPIQPSQPKKRDLKPIS